MNVALVGATGVVGEQIREQFSARSFPDGELRLFASEKSVGEFVDFGGDSLPLLALGDAPFAGIDLVILATPAAQSPALAVQAREAGAFCIDLSPVARLDESRPLLVAGVNDESCDQLQCSVPDSLTVALALLVRGVLQVGTLKSLSVSALSPASDAGRAGIDDLQKQTGELLNGRPLPEGVFGGQLAFNGLPRVDHQAVAELRRVLDLSATEVAINRVQMPAFFGCGGFVRFEFDTPIGLSTLEAAMANQPLLQLRREPELPTPLEAVAEEALLVQFCHRPQEPGQVFECWFAADNIGLATAGNVVRLAEGLAARIG